MEMLNRLKELYPNEAHQYGLLIQKALKIALAKKDPKQKNNAPVLRAPEPCTTKRRRPYISVKVKRKLLHEVQHECTYTSPITHKKCTERKNLQIEHIRPRAKGGRDTPENLTILCQAHNLQKALEEFGSHKMGNHLKSLNSFGT